MSRLGGVETTLVGAAEGGSDGAAGSMTLAVGAGGSMTLAVGAAALGALADAALMTGAAPLAALGYTYLGVAVLFHEGSTVVVVLNAMRLLLYRPR